MTYPPSSPGYPPAPQSGPQYDTTAQTNPQLGKITAPGESRLPELLLAGVAALGLITYLVSFGIDAQLVFSTVPVSALVLASLAAGLLAGASLLPKVRFTAVAAVLATVAALQVIYVGFVAEGDVGWALWTILALTIIQGGTAIGALLYDTGVLKPPAPKPVFEQQPPQYGQYGGPSQYYGQHNQPQLGGQPYQQSSPQGPPQRTGYASQYGGYPGGQNTGGFPTQNPQSSQQSGPPTPPTGFPTYGQPHQQSNASESTTQVPVPPQGQQPSSQQSGQSSS